METKQMYSNLNKFEAWLISEMKKQELNAPKLSKISGVHPNTIRNYLAHRCEPSLYSVLCLVNALGYDVVAVKKDDTE